MSNEIIKNQHDIDEIELGESNSTDVKPIDFQSVQMDLFQNFLFSNKEKKGKLSNTIELWDSLPKYSVSQQSMNKMRNKDGFLPRLEKSFSYRGNEYKVRITAAIIDVDTYDGNNDDNHVKRQEAFYPSANEELVEDALRRIAADQHRGFFHKEEFKSGVVFSLYMLRKELEDRGHSRSYYEIIKSLNILAGSHIEILTANGSGFTKANYLPSLSTVSKYDLLKDRSSKWIAQFHPLVTQCIDAITYRQFNYHQMMLHNSQLARWLHKRLAHNYINASLIVPYSIWISTIQKDSGLLEYSRPSDVIKKFECVLKELVKNNVLSSFSRTEDIRGNQKKIVDIKYALVPHPEFIQEVRAANKRLSDAKSFVEPSLSNLRIYE